MHPRRKQNFIIAVIIIVHSSENLMKGTQKYVYKKREGKGKMDKKKTKNRCESVSSQICAEKTYLIKHYH